MNYKDYIATIPDFPQEGIIFRDITPLMSDGTAFRSACHELALFAKEVGADVIVGPESRGFIFGFVPIRKPNKLPRETISVKYDLEYGSNELHMHSDGVRKGQNVLIVDDLLATGGTVAATIDLVKQAGGTVVGCAFLIELTGLHGRDALQGYPVLALMSYE